MSNPSPSQIILYVEDVAVSAAFYGDLLGAKPFEASPNFAGFAMPSGMVLGLWARPNVQPVAGAAKGGSEIFFAVEEPEAVDALHAEWSRRGLPIAQPPTLMDFGYTFVALDPDGHRLRVCRLTMG